MPACLPLPPAPKAGQAGQGGKAAGSDNFAFAFTHCAYYPEKNGNAMMNGNSDESWRMEDLGGGEEGEGEGGEGDDQEMHIIIHGLFIPLGLSGLRRIGGAGVKEQADSAWACIQPPSISQLFLLSLFPACMHEKGMHAMEGREAGMPVFFLFLIM